jgi:predicted metal-dependent HD superfamily phosphohydrolase
VINKVLYSDWLALSRKYHDDTFLLDSVWKKIENNYTDCNRYYHNFTHIQSMLKLATDNKTQIIDFDSLLFAIWFHDIIYKSSKQNNEVKSAEFTETVLSNFSLSELKIKRISQLIVSTKSHQIILTENNDNAFLLDFDLAILGQDWSIYKTYIQNIRKEYKFYPDFIYNPGRKKVLDNFLNRKTLFFTDKYQGLFEETARENLKRELNLLS